MNEEVRKQLDSAKSDWDWAAGIAAKIGAAGVVLLAKHAAEEFADIAGKLDQYAEAESKKPETEEQTAAGVELIARMHSAFVGLRLALDILETNFPEENDGDEALLDEKKKILELGANCIANLYKAERERDEEAADAPPEDAAQEEGKGEE